MSAISAVFQLDGSPVDVDPVRAMVAQQAAQGPHGSAVWSDGPAALGHNLFRATHESRTESQPCSLEGEVWITADVFLTGRRELVDGLRAAGCEVTLNRPDPELLLHAYRVWGPAMLERLLGYFAFVIWDRPRRRVLAARDHFGNRTLYYAQRGQTLVLCGFLDAVARHPSVGTGLSEFHVACFLALGSVTLLDPAGTAYEGIKKLRPAECLIAERGSITVKRYWECPVEVPLFKYRREEEVVERYREIFAQVIEDHLRTDRLALTVSGGMDSTSVAAMTATVIRKRGYGPELVALCQDHRVINKTDEACLAGLLCRQYDIPLTLMVMDEVPWLTPEYRPVTLMIYPLMNQQQDLVRRLAGLAPAAMFGSCGDWLRSADLRSALETGRPFRAVSGFYRVWERYRIRPNLRFGIGRIVQRLSKDQGHYTPHFPDWLNPAIREKYDLRRAFLDERWNEIRRIPHPNRRHPSLQNWVTYKDPGTVLHGNSARSTCEGLDPLGDRRLFEFLLQLDPMPWLAEKYLQREAMDRFLPSEIRFRPRCSLSSHHAAFLRNPANSWINRSKKDSRLRIFGDYPSELVPIGNDKPVHEAFVDLRPWLLNQWLVRG